LGLGENKIYSILKLKESVEKYPYIKILVNKSRNINKLRRKLIKLPGVQSVKILENLDLNKKVKKLINANGLTEIMPLVSTHYLSLEIGFINTIEKRSVNLIKTYTTKLLGKKNIYFGKLKNFDKISVRNGSNYFASHRAIYLVINCLLLIIWLALLLINNFKIKRLANIYEKFQRKENVYLKLSSFFFLIILNASYLLIKLTSSHVTIGIAPMIGILFLIFITMHIRLPRLLK